MQHHRPGTTRGTKQRNSKSYIMVIQNIEGMSPDTLYLITVEVALNHAVPQSDIAGRGVSVVVQHVVVGMINTILTVFTDMSGQ